MGKKQKNFNIPKNPPPMPSAFMRGYAAQEAPRREGPPLQTAEETQQASMIPVFVSQGGQVIQVPMQWVSGPAQQDQSNGACYTFMPMQGMQAMPQDTPDRDAIEQQYSVNAQRDQRQILEERSPQHHLQQNPSGMQMMMMTPPQQQNSGDVGQQSCHLQQPSPPPSSLPSQSQPTVEEQIWQLQQLGQLLQQQTQQTQPQRAQGQQQFAPHEPQAMPVQGQRQLQQEQQQGWQGQSQARGMWQRIAGEEEETIRGGEPPAIGGWGYGAAALPYYASPPEDSRIATTPPMRNVGEAPMRSWAEMSDFHLRRNERQAPNPPPEDFMHSVFEACHGGGMRNQRFQTRPNSGGDSAYHGQPKGPMLKGNGQLAESLPQAGGRRRSDADAPRMKSKNFGQRGNGAFQPSSELLAGTCEAPHLDESHLRQLRIPGDMSGAMRGPPGESSNHNWMLAPSETMKAQLQALQLEDPATVFIARRINKLGFSSAEILRAYFNLYGPVKNVYVSHSRVKSLKPLQGERRSSDAHWRLRAAALGFVVMSSADATARILAEGPEHVVNGVTVRLQPFHRRAGTEGEEEGGTGAQEYPRWPSPGSDGEQQRGIGMKMPHDINQGKALVEGELAQLYNNYVISGGPILYSCTGQELANAAPEYYSD